MCHERWMDKLVSLSYTPFFMPLLTARNIDVKNNKFQLPYEIKIVDFLSNRSRKCACRTYCSLAENATSIEMNDEKTGTGCILGGVRAHQNNCSLLHVVRDQIWGINDLRPFLIQVTIIAGCKNELEFDSSTAQSLRRFIVAWSVRTTVMLH
jgi:hypothetical protein